MNGTRMVLETAEIELLHDLVSREIRSQIRGLDALDSDPVRRDAAVDQIRVLERMVGRLEDAFERSSRPPKPAKAPAPTQQNAVGNTNEGDQS